MLTVLLGKGKLRLSQQMLVVVAHECVIVRGLRLVWEQCTSCGCSSTHGTLKLRVLREGKSFVYA